jgi:hypothetical protein
LLPPFETAQRASSGCEVFFNFDAKLNRATAYDAISQEFAIMTSSGTGAPRFRRIIMGNGSRFEARK